jgi:hypothetical protein
VPFGTAPGPADPSPGTAEAMRVSRGTVKSTTARALAAVGRMLREEQ